MRVRIYDNALEFLVMILSITVSSKCKMVHFMLFHTCKVFTGRLELGIKGIDIQSVHAIGDLFIGRMGNSKCNTLNVRLFC